MLHNRQAPGRDFHYRNDNTRFTLESPLPLASANKPSDEPWTQASIRKFAFVLEPQRIHK